MDPLQALGYSMVIGGALVFIILTLVVIALG